MESVTFQKLFLTASLYELFNGRLPDFRGTAAVRNLKRIGIEATSEKYNDELVRVTAIAMTEKHITYLEIRGYTRKKPKKKKAKPEPSYSDVVQTILARPFRVTPLGVRF